MRRALWQLGILLLCLPTLLADSFSPSQVLQATLSGNGPFVVLGMVSDSEQQTTITEEGIELRKSMELAIQSLGEEVTPLASSERMKLERLWSLPFTGRVSDELKAELHNLKSGLITGSFSPHHPEDLMVIVMLASGNRSLVFHEKSGPSPLAPVIHGDAATPTPVSSNNPDEAITPSQPSSTIPPPDKPQAPSDNPPVTPGVLSLGTRFPTSRTLPKESRRTRKVSTQQKLEQLKLELLENEVLREFSKERSQLSDQQKLVDCQNLIDSAQNTLLTSSKIEFLRRAFILNASMASPSKELERHTLERLLEHKEFFNEPSFD